MPEVAKSDTRAQLMEAAAELIAASPGEDFSLRDVCDRVGVRMPTLYHFFGSKQGLIDAVVEHGFELYLEAKRDQESSGDPIADIRGGWDAHVRFGLENPGFYTLMYGKVRPGYSPAAQAKPTMLLMKLTERAAAEGRLAVSPEQAAAHILAANIGVTLRGIILAESDPELSVAMREATIAGITGEGGGSASSDDVRRVASLASGVPEVLGEAETALLSQWLRRLADHLD
ncbi:TetR/AcrR family transcriptional regulator [Gordonia sp. HY285]|uniref:TetR/AcrR family transcriptional regulator n=1 Tax=Gordonia liuliyuniae TaxID=2911517 RepID=UPI001F1A0FF6|nr:TetR/AcrR family transcriptional regulator [Gordonia liuliyuniae]MCF8609791.1 TetR/AcrR family transcriptional regulator [Gordonia liuliyuniae]